MSRSGNPFEVLVGFHYQGLDGPLLFDLVNETAIIASCAAPVGHTVDR